MVLRNKETYFVWVSCFANLIKYSYKFKRGLNSKRNDDCSLSSKDSQS